MRSHTHICWLVLALATCYLLPAYAALDPKDEAERREYYRNLSTLKIDDHQYRSIGPGISGPGKIAATLARLQKFGNWLAEAIIFTIEEFDPSNANAAEAFLDQQLFGTRRAFTNQFFLVMLIALDQNKQQSIGKRSGISPLQLPSGIIYTSKSGRDYTFDARTFQGLKTSISEFVGLLNVVDPSETKNVLIFLSGKTLKPAYYTRHEILAKQLLDNWDQFGEAKRRESRETIRQVFVEALFLKYLWLRVENRNFPSLPMLDMGKRSLPNFRTFLPPLSTVSLSGSTFNAKSTIVFAPEITYSNSPGGVEVGVRPYLPSKYGVAVFSNLDISPSSRALVHSLSNSRRIIEDYHNFRTRSDEDLEQLRDEVLFSIYGVSRRKRAGVADSFDRAAEATKPIASGTYHTFGENGNVSQGGITISRLFRVRPLSDDSVGLRLTGSLQTVSVQSKSGHWSELRPSFGVVFQNKVQNLQLPENPFNLIVQEDTNFSSLNLSPAILRKTNRQLGLIRWNYQFGIEYSPNTALTECDSYQLFVRYRLQPKKPRDSVSDWERHITDFTFSIGKGGDRSLFLGFTVTKGIRL